MIRPPHHARSAQSLPLTNAHPLPYHMNVETFDPGLTILESFISILESPSPFGGKLGGTAPFMACASNRGVRAQPVAVYFLTSKLWLKACTTDSLIFWIKERRAID